VDVVFPLWLVSPDLTDTLNRGGQKSNRTKKHKN
jgi:hypothetical protein